MFDRLSHGGHHHGGCSRRFANGEYGGDSQPFGRERRGRGGGGSGLGRFFAHGDLRLVVLQLIAEKPRHGYEVIKAIEERVAGAYSPSPGVVYPTLTWLGDLGYVTVSTGEGNKKLHAITAEGQAFLDANRTAVDALLAAWARPAAHTAEHRRRRSCARWKTSSSRCGYASDEARSARTKRTPSGPRSTPRPPPWSGPDGHTAHANLRGARTYDRGAPLLGAAVQALRAQAAGRPGRTSWPDRLPTGVCQLDAEAETLVMRVRAGDEGALATLVNVLARHLERFAFRDKQSAGCKHRARERAAHYNEKF